MEEKIIVTPKQLGTNIRRLRLLHGETQKQLAEITNLCDSTIANYEKGELLCYMEKNRKKVLP